MLQSWGRSTRRQSESSKSGWLARGTSCWTNAHPELSNSRRLPFTPGLLSVLADHGWCRQRATDGVALSPEGNAEVVLPRARAGSGIASARRHCRRPYVRSGLRLTPSGAPGSAAIMAQARAGVESHAQVCGAPVLGYHVGQGEWAGYEPATARCNGLDRDRRHAAKGGSTSEQRPRH